MKFHKDLNRRGLVFEWSTFWVILPPGRCGWWWWELTDYFQELFMDSKGLNSKTSPLLFRPLWNFMSSYYWLVHEQLLKTVCQFSPPSSSSSWRQYHSKGAPLENQEAQKPRHSLLLFKTWWKKTNFSMAAQIQFLPSQTQICTILPIILLHFHNSNSGYICYYHIGRLLSYYFWSRFKLWIWYNYPDSIDRYFCVVHTRFYQSCYLY